MKFSYKTANIFIKDNSLSTMLTATVNNSKNHKKVILFSTTFTFRWCNDGQYYLFM